MTLTESPSLLVAGIGEMVLSSSPDAHLVAYGLGSCIALAVWDPGSRSAGWPTSCCRTARQQRQPGQVHRHRPRHLLKALEAKGAVLNRSVLKAAGAAAMLTVGGGLAIGKRNAESMQAALTERGLSLTATALGGNAGRTVQLEVADGRFLIKSLSSVSEL
jgi:chemotaxis protein CheD